MPRGSAKKFLRRRADHHGARIAREQEQAIFKPRHHRVHILPHGAENFVHATQLLTNLRNLPAHESEFVGALGDALGVGSRGIILASGDAIQLFGDVAQRSQRCAAHDRSKQCRNHHRQQRDRPGSPETGRDFIQQQAGVEHHAHLSERLTAFVEGVIEFKKFRRSRQDFHLVQKIALHQLRERRSSRKRFSGQTFIRGNQNHAILIRDGDFVNQRILFRRFQLGMKAFVDFEGVAHEIVNFLW